MAHRFSVLIVFIYFFIVDFEFIVNVVVARGLDNDVSFVMFYDSPLFSLNDNIQAVSLVDEPNFLTNKFKLNYYWKFKRWIGAIEKRRCHRFQLCSSFAKKALMNFWIFNCCCLTRVIVAFKHKSCGPMLDSPRWVWLTTLRERVCKIKCSFLKLSNSDERLYRSILKDRLLGGNARKLFLNVSLRRFRTTCFSMFMSILE